MRRFLVKLVVFAMIFFLVEKVLAVFLYIAPSKEKDKRLEYVINGQINKEIIILGSSRGARNIIASQIADSLKQTCYNLAYPGSDIEFHEFVLRSLLRFNKKPQLVILAVDDPSELLPNESINFRLERLYPLVKYEYITDELIKRSEKNFLAKFLVLGRINKSNFDLREKHFTPVDSIKADGSMPIYFQRKDIKLTYEEKPQLYPMKDELPVKIQAFQAFQNLCEINHIKLLIVFSPNFKRHNLAFENRLRQVSSPTVSFYRYDTLNQVYHDNAYFYDQSHLITKGAVIFTNEIITEIRKNR